MSIIIEIHSSTSSRESSQYCTTGLHGRLLPGQQFTSQNQPATYGESQAHSVYYPYEAAASPVVEGKKMELATDQCGEILHRSLPIES